MTPLENAIFGPDPWWIVAIKVVGVFALLLTWTIINVWFERRVLGKMQNRKGPTQNSPGGILQAAGDGIKLVFKEQFLPKGVDKVIFNLAPILCGIAAFTSWSVIPLGGEVNLFGHRTNLQITDLPVAGLFILAVASIGIYGIVLAGWSSDNSYSLLGGLRSSAQMISYEVAMGLSLVAVFMMANSMSTSQIVAAQTQRLNIFGVNTGIPGWYALLLIPSFVIYVISMLGESNRVPFDLPECESELVSGYSTEYTGFRYGMYYLAEYINMATLSAVCVTLFLGGYHAPWPLNLVPGLDSGWWTLLWFLIKTQLVIFFFVWTRAAVPRFRYDTFMDLGWKVLIPVSLAWILMVAVLKTGQNQGWFANWIFWAVMVAVVLAILAGVMFLGKAEEDNDELNGTEFDAFAGGYPVPPMPGEALTDRTLVRADTAETTATTTRGVEL